jgi:hypothetical protein
LVEDNAHPQKLTNSALTDADVINLKAGFAAEIKSFRKRVFKQLIFNKKEAANNMKQLVSISDTGPSLPISHDSSVEKDTSAALIKSIYVDTLNFLKIQLEDMARLAPKIQCSMNKRWNKEHLMPSHANVEQRVAWHMARQQFCACRPIPKKLLPFIDGIRKGRKETK